MRWFRDHPRITLAIVIVLVLLIVFYVSLLSVGKDNFLGRTLGTAVVNIQKPFTFIGNGISGKVKSFAAADEVESENEELKTKIAELEDKLARERLNKSELKELQQLSKAFKNKKTMKDYKPVVGEIISYDGSSVFNVFTVDAGTDVNVKINDAVINDQGLIGRVTSVGKNWCKVVTIIDESNKIGFQLSKNLRFRGVCQGSGKGDLSGYMFDTKSPVEENDEVLTSGIGGVYPPGLTVGKVEKVEKSKESQLRSVTLEPAVSFNSIKKVAVLTGYKEGN